MDCLVCDRPACDTVTLVERLGVCASQEIGAREQLVTLVLDIVGHVADLGENPVQVRGWLADAAQWRAHPEWALAASEEALAARNAAMEYSERPKCVLQAATWATWAAKKAMEGRHQSGWIVSATVNALAAAVTAAADPKREASWQTERIRASICTCPDVPDAIPLSERSRNSLLAH